MHTAKGEVSAPVEGRDRLLTQSLIFGREFEGATIIDRLTVPMPRWHLRRGGRTALPVRDYHSRVVGEMGRAFRRSNLKTAGKPRFLLRVDDFPAPGYTLEQFMEFHEIMREHDIPYLLGVTPFLAEKIKDPYCSNFRTLSDRELSYLKSISGDVELGMHGVTHRVNVPPTSYLKNSEFIGLTDDELLSKLKAGSEAISQVSAAPAVIVPPFNTFNLSQVDVMRQLFRIVAGGPESIPLVGLRLSPSYLRGMLYVPSYWRAYGKASEVSAFLEKVQHVEWPLVIPLTLHWHWELGDGYRELRRLSNLLRGRVTPWKAMTQSASTLT